MLPLLEIRPASHNDLRNSKMTPRRRLVSFAFAVALLPGWLALSGCAAKEDAAPVTTAADQAAEESAAAASDAYDKAQ